MIRRKEQVITLPLVAPVDAGAAPQTTQAPLRVENAVPTRRGAWGKRRGQDVGLSGYTLQTSLIRLLGGVALVAGCRASAWKSYSPSSGNVTDLCSGDPSSAFVFSSVENKDVYVDASLSTDNPPLDVVAHGSVYAVMAYQGITTAAELHLLVVDRYTGAKLSDTTLSTTANAMGRFALGSALTVWYENTGGVLCSRTIGTDGSVGTEKASALGVVASSYVHIDAVASGSSVWVVFANTGGALGLFYSATGDASAGSAWAVTAAGPTLFGVSIAYQSSTSVLIGWISNPGAQYDVMAISFDTGAGAANWTAVTLESMSTVGWDPPQSIIVTSRIGTGNSTAYTLPGTVIYSRNVKTAVVEDRAPELKRALVGGSGGAGAGTAASWIFNARVASKTAPLDQVSSDSYAISLYMHTWGKSTTTGPFFQSTLVVVADDGSPLVTVARDVPRVCRRIQSSMLPDSLSGSRLYTIGWRRVVDAVGDSLTSAGTERRMIDVSIVKLGTTRPAYVDLPDSTYFAGGTPVITDGNSCFEQGFLQYPDGLTVASSGVAGQLTVAGVYKFVATYSTVDASGRWHRSAPTPIAASYTPAAAADTGPNVYVPCLPVTMRRAQTVLVEIWRTVSGGSQFYLDTSATHTRTASYQSVRAGVISDANLPSSEPLYTDDGELENVSPSSYDAFALHRDRLWYAPIDQVGSLQHSKHVGTRSAIGFNDALSVELPSGTGKVTVLASLVDYLLAFTARRIVVVQGDGRDDAGSGSDPSPIWVLNDGMGCTAAGSIMRTPQGLYFQATDGMVYLLTPSLEMRPIGEPVRYELETYGTITSVAYDTIESAAVFGFASATFDLRYYEQRGIWVRHTVSSATRSLCSSDAGLIRFDTAGKLWKSSASVYKDDGSFVTMLVDTGWISAAGTGGWQRLYNLLIAGDFIDPASLKVEIAYDYAPAWTTVGTYDATALTAFDWHAQFGAGSAAYADNALLLRVTPSRTKCAAFRVRISDVVHASTSTGAGFALVALGAVVGGMPGPAQVDSARQMG